MADVEISSGKSSNGNRVPLAMSQVYDFLLLLD
jgi:hypothetical protein